VFTETEMLPGVVPDCVAVSHAPPFDVETVVVYEIAEPLEVTLIDCAAGLAWPGAPLKVSEVGATVTVDGEVTVIVTGMLSWLASEPLEVNVTEPL
jgi:hypothetical protein